MKSFSSHNSNGREAGIGKLTAFVFVVLIGAGIFSSYKIGTFYYYFHEIQGQADAAVKLAETEDDAEIRKRLWYHIKKAKLPVDPEDLRIVREVNRLTIRLDYEEVFYVSFQGEDYDIHTFPFSVFARREFESRR